MTTEYTDDQATWPSIKPTPTTKELQDHAIQAARDLDWIVCSEGNDYAACVIAWSKRPGTQNGSATNWCRVMTIIDGIAQTEQVSMPEVYGSSAATVMNSGYVSKRLEQFKLNTQY